MDGRFATHPRGLLYPVDGNVSKVGGSVWEDVGRDMGLTFEQAR